MFKIIQYHSELYKHVVTVHIISRRGATKLIIYTGRTNSSRFQELGGQFLVPFFMF